MLYQEVVARGALPAVGGCSNWKVSTGSALSTTLLTQVATSVSMFVYNDNRSVIITFYILLFTILVFVILNLFPSIPLFSFVIFSNVGTTVQCNSGTSATDIIKAVSNAGTIMTNVTCDGHTWKVQRCKGASTSLCVDCTNPCTPTPTSCSSLKTFNPCSGSSGINGGSDGAGYGCAQTQTNVNMFRVLSGTFQLNPAFIPPVVSTLTTVASKTSAVVSALLSSDGTV